jgi:four helix bundle protein
MKYSQSFRKLIVWQKAKELTLYVYDNMDGFPKTEQYALCSQLKRASYSVIANIAEGNNRRTKKDKIHFFTMSLSSLTELDCLLELSHDLKFVKDEAYEIFQEEVNKTAYLLRRLITGADKKLSPRS